MTIREHIGIGIIGAGGRGIACLGRHIVGTCESTGFRITALHDINATRVREARDFLTAAFAARAVHADITCHASNEALVQDPRVDIVLVTTPQYAHRAGATTALRAGKRTYVDKPIAHTLEDAAAIVAEETRAQSPVLMGFTRRYERAWREAFALVEAGEIGAPHMLLLRAVIPSHVYFHKFYRRREWSGGVLNEKSAHHFDVFSWFARSRPTALSAIGGQAVFAPRPDTPARCSECTRDCPYRVRRRGTTSAPDEVPVFGQSWMDESEEVYRHDNCVWLAGADICDHAVVQVAYENGVKACLYLSVFGPQSHDQETFEIVGTSGRIILTRHSAGLDVVADHGRDQRTVDCSDAETRSSHFGADLELLREMRSWCDGAPPLVSAADGFVATRMSLAAVDSVSSGGRQITLV